MGSRKVAAAVDIYTASLNDGSWESSWEVGLAGMFMGAHMYNKLRTLLAAGWVN